MELFAEKWSGDVKRLSDFRDTLRRFGLLNPNCLDDISELIGMAIRIRMRCRELNDE